jgi:hypothetical protein
MKNNKGGALIETAFVVMFFMVFVIYLTPIAITTIEISREARAAGMVTDMIEQIHTENGSVNATDVDQITSTVVGMKYLGVSEDYRVLVSKFSTDGSGGYSLVSTSASGPNSTSSSRVTIKPGTDPNPGVAVGNYSYLFQASEMMYVTEIFTGKRGTRNVSGNLPYYQFSISVVGP